MADSLKCLRAKIVLLSLLTQCPEPPSINSFGDLTESYCPSQSAWLERKHEKALVEHLAFLCSYSAKRENVVAVCVEQNSSGNGVVIRLAANSGSHEKLNHDLPLITKILENEACDVNRQLNREKLLQTSFNLALGRILLRLKGKNTKGPTLLEKIQTARRLLLTITGKNDSPGTLSNDLWKLERHLARINILSSTGGMSSQGGKLLLDLVQCSYRLNCNHEEELKTIPISSPAWHQDDTNSLLDRLQKLGHYVEACDGLLRLARRYSQLSNIAVKFIEMQQSGPMFPDLAVAEKLAIVNASFSKSTLSMVSNRMGMGLPMIVNKIANGISGDGRIHAEIQIISFYETNPSHQRPRVIAATKRACFLCNCFAKALGTYVIPASHGRIYDKWRWPGAFESGSNKHLNLEMNTFQHLIPKFTAQIELKIAEILRTPPSVRWNAPRESVVAFVPITPTVSVVTSVTNPQSGHLIYSDASSRSIREGSDRLSKGALNPSASKLPSPPASHTSFAHSKAGNLVIGSSSSQIEAANTIFDKVSEGTLEASSQTQPRNSEPLSGTHMNLSTTSYPSDAIVTLLVGESHQCTLTESDSTIRVHVPKIHLEFEYDSRISRGNISEASQAQGRKVQISFTCLPSPTLEPTQAVDLDEVGWEEMGGLESKLLSPEGVLLKRRSTLLQIRAHFL